MPSSFTHFVQWARGRIAPAATARPPARPPRALSAGTALQWAAAVAVCMSTQYLFQPFVWKNWPISDVLVGWTEVARDRVLVAAMIALAVTGASRLPAQRLSLRTGALALAIVVGAAAGEITLLAAGSAGAPGDPESVLGRVAHWFALALCVSGIHYLWLRDSEARSAARANELSRSTAEAALVRTQLELLQRQIEPHFLFNTLATIRRLRETEPEAGLGLLRHLRAYLQPIVSGSGPATTLGAEVDLAESYLAIVAERMSGRLTVDIDVPEALRGCVCPPMTLATLVENAVKHGITPAPEGGTIAIRARRRDRVLEVAVVDTGVGFAGRGLPPVGGTGIGLANVRARLRALHGRSATLSITAGVPRGVSAVMRLPLAGGAQ